MKKIIRNKLYDTDTATEIGVDCGGGQGPRDFRYWAERLYRKRTGEYFLHGEGGPLTQYARWLDGNNRSGGEKIIPMTYEAARSWAEEHLSADEYQAEFGPVDEGGDGVDVHVVLPAGIAESLRRQARETGKSLTTIIQEKLQA